MGVIIGLYEWCHSCKFWKWEATVVRADGSKYYPGHCGLESATCINQVSDHPETKPIHHQKLETDES